MSTTAVQRERADIRAILGGRPLGTIGGLARWRKWLLPLALAGAALAIAYLAIGRPGASINYVTVPASRGQLVVQVTATGTIQPTRTVAVSSELSGTVRKVLVDYNSIVKANEPLAELDTDKLKAATDGSKARLDAARARLVEAEAAALEAKRDFNRKRVLAGKKVIAPRDLDVAQAANDRAAAAITSAKADIAVAEAEHALNVTNLAKACICSPIDGVVLERNVDPGQTVAASLQAPVLFTIAEDLRKMELQVDVDEADVGQVKVGQTAVFRVDAFPDREFPAVIEDIRFSSETIQGVVTYKASLTVDNSELLLRPGMTATADIRVSEVSDALLVTNAALRYQPPAEAADDRGWLSRIMPRPPRFTPASAPDQRGSDRTIWVLVDGVPKELKVKIGLSDGARTEIKSGALEAGEAVVTDQTTGTP